MKRRQRASVHVPSRFAHFLRGFAHFLRGFVHFEVLLIRQGFLCSPRLLTSSLKLGPPVLSFSSYSAKLRTLYYVLYRKHRFILILSAWKKLKIFLSSATLI